MSRAKVKTMNSKMSVEYYNDLVTLQYNDLGTSTFDLEVGFDLELCKGHVKVNVRSISRSNVHGKGQGYEQ